MRRILFALVPLLAVAFGSPALGQGNTTGLVVSTCGAPVTAFVSGRPGPFTVDVNGNLCGSSSTLPTGAATAANQVLEIAALNTLIAQAVPSCTAAPVVSTAAEDSRVLKASAGTLCGLTVTSLSAVSGYVMVFNSTTEPADGAVTPLMCVPIGPVGSQGLVNLAYGTGFGSTYSTGITASISSTGCFTKTTTSMSAFFAGQVL